MSVRVLLTGRAGGVSQGDFASLNLASHVGDDPAAVAQNRARVAAAVGVGPDRLVVLAAVSGGPVARVDGTGPREVTGVEALVSTDADLALAVIAADCVPVLLADDEAGVVAVAHAGRRGVAARIVPDAVAALVQAGGSPGRTSAWVGPAICGRCYEVGEQVAAPVVALEPAAAATTRWGTPGLDLVAAVREQLRRAGVDEVSVDGRCTLEDEQLFSYRRDGRTGRHAAVVVRTAATWVGETGESA
jgi:YfiH family protein